MHNIIVLLYNRNNYYIVYSLNITMIYYFYPIYQKCFMYS